MPMLDELLKSCNLEVKDFDLYSCCTGPGSFTGVRIGVSTVKAFNDVTQIPIASVSSLESLAYNALDSKFCNESNLVCSILDAKNDNVYYGLFEKNGESFSEKEKQNAKNIDEMIETLKDYYSSPILFIGDGVNVHKEKLIQSFSKAIFVEDKYNVQTAVSVGKAGFIHYKQGSFGDSNSITPLYLRKSQAERALEGEK